MKYNIIKVFIFLLVAIFLSKASNVFSKEINAQEINENETSIEKINVDVNSIFLDITNNTGIINIENDFFKINASFTSYYLEDSAVSYNSIILECDNPKIKYMSLDFENQTLKYIVIVDNVHYCSVIEFNRLFCSIDLFDENIQNETIQLSSLRYTDNKEKYIFLEDSTLFSYFCFKTQKNINARNSKSFLEFDLTGDSEEVELAEMLVEYVLEEGVLTTIGLHYGKKYDADNKLSNIYIVDTKNDGSEDIYLSRIKIMEIAYKTLESNPNSSEKMIDIKILKSYEFFIVGDSNSRKVAFVSQGSAAVPLKSIAFNFTTSNYTYISKYKVGYTFEDGDSASAWLTTADFLLGKFTPYYEGVKSLINGIDSIVDRKQEVSFDNKMEEFNIVNGTESMRSIGFKVTDEDVGKGIFNDRHLHQYSFFQIITVSGLPHYNIDSFMEIQIVPFYNAEQVLTYSWDMKIMNDINCNHAPQYEDKCSEIHLKSCNLCGYSYYDEHTNGIYENQTEYMHITKCIYCYHSSLEEHVLRFTITDEYCLNCDFSQKLTVNYISSGDGKTHIRKTKAGSTIENCLGLDNGSGNTFCTKCGQKLKNGFGGGVLMSKSKDDELVMCLEKSSWTICLNKKETDDEADSKR